MTILFAGDPHRNFSPIVRACLARTPGTLILLGDLDCQLPFRQTFAQVLSAGWHARWILGNHDCETETAYDNLVGDYPEGDLGYRVSELDGVRVGGATEGPVVARRYAALAPGYHFSRRRRPPLGPALRCAGDA